MVVMVAKHSEYRKIPCMVDFKLVQRLDFFKNIYLFIWLCWVVVPACGIFHSGLTFSEDCGISVP